nr:MAG TPA: hypothetical protein [Bacteriophage sp.]
MNRHQYSISFSMFIAVLVYYTAPFHKWNISIIINY